MNEPRMVRAARSAARSLFERGGAVLDSLPLSGPHIRDGQRLDPQTRSLLLLLRATGLSAIHRMTPEEARTHLLTRGPVFDRPPVPLGDVRDLTLRAAGYELPARLYRPGDAPRPGPLLVWFHGGGFVIGNLRTHDSLLRNLAARAGIAIISVDYRLAPEHVFPAAHDDAIAAYRNIVARAPELGTHREAIAVGGDSAGGNLAAYVARQTRGEETPSPLLQVLVCPLVDMMGSSRSRETFREGYLLDQSLIDWFEQHFLGDGDRMDFRLSPLLADDHGGLPPAIVALGGFDPLRDEGRAYGVAMRGAGTDVEIRNFEGLIHGFWQMGGASVAAARAVDELADRIARRVQRAVDARGGLRVSFSLSVGPPYPRTCVIGAGSSGIAALKVLSHGGVPTTCFEMSDRIGGNWAFENPNGVSAAYRSLHINTSRRTMAYADYPMPEDYPDYPNHWQIAEYFENYVDDFGLRDDIRFQNTVEQVTPVDGGGWRVKTSRGDDETFDAVVVANGHHWSPHWPDPPHPGPFDGVRLHSHEYRDPSTPHDLRGKRVVIVGFGNSAVDIACELSHKGVAERVYLSTRRGNHVFPHYIMGVPADEILHALPVNLASSTAGRKILGALQRVSVGRMSDYGLPEPDHDVFEAHPTVSSELLVRLGRGDIERVPEVERFDGRAVHFANGQVEEADAVIYCTGYDIRFPFLDDAVLPVRDNDVSLYRHVVPPDWPGLYIVGLVQPLGAIMPIAEAQARWIGELLRGEGMLPPRDEMWEAIAEDRREMTERYVGSRRHTIQVDFMPYLNTIYAERAECAMRAGALTP